jgi:hypothetical protein
VGPEAASKVARALRKERSLKDHAAKDILRAANLPLLGPEDPEVAADLNKVKLGERLSHLCRWSKVNRCGSLVATSASAPATTWMRKPRCSPGSSPACLRLNLYPPISNRQASWSA